MEKLKLLKLFDNPTRSQISLNLIVYKELSASQLSKKIDKNISTITRNLEEMKEVDLIRISRTEMKNNFQIKFWKLNPSILEVNLSLSEEFAISLSDKKRKELLKQVDNLMILTQGIIKSILEQGIRNRRVKTNLHMLFLDKKAAKLLDEEFGQFIQSFLERNQSRISSDLESIGEENFLFFSISSQLKKVLGKSK